MLPLQLSQSVRQFPEVGCAKRNSGHAARSPGILGARTEMAPTSCRSIKWWVMGKMAICDVRSDHLVLLTPSLLCDLDLILPTRKSHYRALQSGRGNEHRHHQPGRGWMSASLQSTQHRAGPQQTLSPHPQSLQVLSGSSPLRLMFSPCD